jgi:hypothetical protein
MADRYWVGGSGNWDATSTTNWAATSGGTAGASAPTSADNVIFDANSNVGTDPFTVTVTGDSGSPALCNDFTASGLDGAMTLSMGATAVLDCYGSMTLPATNFTWTGTQGAFLNFRATTTGKTITTNGVSVTLTALVFNGIGGEWTLGSALSLTISSAQSIDLQRGTFRTGNYNITSSSGGIRIFATGDARAMYLGSSTITLANTTAVWNTQSPTTNLTFDAGTSTITTATASAIFTGGGLTFHNVEFSGGAGTKTINDANTFSGQFLVSNAAATTIAFSANQTFTGGALIQATAPSITGSGFSYTGTVDLASAAHGTKSIGQGQTFQNLTVTCPAVDGNTTLSIGVTVTVTGTLTTTNGGSTSRRVQIIGFGSVQRTLSVGTNSLINTDFGYIAAAGTASWVFGLGYGDLGNNSGITFDTSTLYWIGGTGNWSDGTKWSTSSGGSAANAIPLYQNSVIFDAASNTGTNPFTVTVDGTSSAPSVCNDFSTGGAGGALDGAMTLAFGATGDLIPYGSLTLPATNFSISASSGATLRFYATTTGHTITTNGVSLTNLRVDFNGVGGEWTLGSSLTYGSSQSLNIIAGSFITSNYNLTGSVLNASGSNTKSANFGSSTITLSGSSTFSYSGTNLTFNAGTSQITCSNASPTFTGGGQTFYNVSFTSAASGTTTINGANTFNNLSQTSRSATGRRAVVLGANQTVSGTLTLGAANTAIRRIVITSDVVGTQRTITLNGTLATLADVDFRDINAAGTVATPWTGTRLGNALGNANITFATPKTVYWNLSGSQNWSATGWALTNNGTPAANNFPLAQDTATFTEAGAAGTVTLDQAWYIGSIQMADGVSNRTTAFTLATGAQSPNIYGNITLFSNLTLSGTGTFDFLGQGTTQTITSAGVSFTQPININSPSGTVQLLNNTTVSNTVTLTAGTLDLSSGNRTLICNTFSSSNSNTRSIAFGTGNITVTGNNATVINIATSTNLTYTGTPTVNFSYSGSTGTRTLTYGGTGASETNALNLNVTAGTDIVAISNASQIKNLSFTGFAGTLNNNTRTIYGNLTIVSGMTLVAGTSTTTFAATSGTQQVTTNSQTLDFPVTHNGAGGTVQLQDNLTMGSTRTVTLTNGTLDLNNLTLSCGLFSSSNSNTRAIAFGTGNVTLTGNNATVWTTSTSTGFTTTGTPTVNFSYSGSTGTRTIINASGIAESSQPNFNISAGSDIISFVSACKSLNFTGFTGTLSNGSRNIYGNLTISSGMSLDAGTGTTTFAATSGTQQVTTNGKTLDFPITINGVGGTVELQDALTMGSTRSLILNAGIFTTNDYNVTTGRIRFETTGVREINLGSSSITLNGPIGASSASWYVVDGTNLTINAGTSTINLNKSLVIGEVQGFYSNGFTYHNLNISNGCDVLIYGGSNTFNNISNNFSPVVITFENGTTQTVSNFTVSGTPSNLVTLESYAPGSVWYLTKTSGTVTVTYCDISDSDANGGATFNCINGVNSGNNTGWNFSSSSFSSGNFLAFF